jgi:hypothetical protein
MRRVIQPELLDSLSPDDPDARRNRRDLRVINRAMGNFRWFERVLPPLVSGAERVLEIGAGTGELGRRLAESGVAADGLDLWPRPALWPADRAWHQADLRAFDGYGGYGATIANLVLHQFTDSDLAELGLRLRRHVRLILACEPARRRRWQLLCGALAPVCGANYVTRHDARVSISAGFRGQELPQALGLDPGQWHIRCAQSALGAYRMVAIRRT